MPTNTLTKTEFEIMKYLWDADTEVTARDIRLHFKSKNWSKQTVSTFLKKLVKLGYIHMRKESLSKYYYTAAITEDAYNISPAIEIMDKFYYGSLCNFICALVHPEDITDEQIKQLDDLILRYKNHHENDPS